MQSAEKVSITIPPEMMRTIRDTVEAGEFASTSEAFRDAVRVWQRQRLEDAERLQAIRERVRRSLDDPRPDMTSDAVDAHFKELFATTAKARSDATT